MVGSEPCKELKRPPHPFLAGTVPYYPRITLVLIVIHVSCLSLLSHTTARIENRVVTRRGTQKTRCSRRFAHLRLCRVQQSSVWREPNDPRGSFADSDLPGLVTVQPARLPLKQTSLSHGQAMSSLFVHHSLHETRSPHVRHPHEDFWPCKLQLWPWQLICDMPVRGSRIES